MSRAGSRRNGGEVGGAEGVGGKCCSGVLRNIKIKAGGIDLGLTFSPVDQDVPGSLKTSEDRRECKQVEGGGGGMGRGRECE